MTRRHALVTGGSRGIGFSAAQRLLADGFRVTITGRDQARLDEARDLLGGTHVQTLGLDATDHDASAAAFAAAEVDVLVANVGAALSASVADTNLDAWRRVLDTNVTAAFVAIQAVLPRMLEQDHGRIVTVGSLASHRPIRFGAAYTSSKHALLGLTRAVALDCRGKDVTANMVAPAFVRTEMMTENARKISEASGRPVEEVERKLASVSDFGRLIEPEEVAHEISTFVADGSRTGEITIMGDAAS